MPAFTPKRAHIIDNTIRNLFNRVGNFFECELNPEEIKHMVVRPEHIAVLDQAYDIMYGSTSAGTHNFAIRIPRKDIVTGVKVTLHSGSGFNFLMPAYVNDDTIAQPCEARDKIERWVEERITRGIEWGRVVEVFRYLQERCTSPQQLRFYFPGIVTLLVNTGDDKLEKIGAKLRSARTPSEFLTLNREAKEYITAANATLATAQLFLQSPTPARPNCRPALYAGNIYTGAKCVLDGSSQVVL